MSMHDGLFGPGAALARRRAMTAMAGAGVATATLTFGPGQALAACDLTVFDWTGYEVPQLHEAYIKKYGKSPCITVYADVYEAFNKIEAGFRCDTVHPNIWDVRRFYDAKLLQPWDTSKLSYWPDVFPQFPTMPGAQYDGKQYLIPTDWGINALIVRSDKIDLKGQTPSWNLLWDKTYAGRISMNTEMDATVEITALVLGIKDPFNATDEEIAAIKKKLQEQRPLIRFYWSDPTQLEQAIASGEIIAAWAWPQVYGDLSKEGQPVAYYTPKEGVYSWVTGFCHLANAPGKTQNAYDYVDAWLSPETGKWLIENYGYGHTNRKSFDLVSAATLKAKGLGSPEKVLGAAHTVKEWNPEVRKKFVDMYEEVKAGY